MNDEQAFQLICLIANKSCDSHFTIMKFSSNWKLSFGPQIFDDGRDDIDKMPTGETLFDALVDAVAKGRGKDWWENG